jgi:hypothetical protein
MSHDNYNGGGRNFRYNQQYNGQGNNSNFSPYAGQNQRPYNQGFNNAPRGGSQNFQPKKHSGAKGGNDKNGNPYVRGWNFSKRNGLRAFFCSPYKNTTKHEAEKSGRVYENWMCKVTLSDGQTFIKGCLYEAATGKVTISDMGMVINPRANNGGYCGTFSK